QCVWRKLGFSTALEYLEDVFGYAPRTAMERLRVARELAELPALEAELRSDRLLLGMKGTMADFELVWLRQRMEGGRWHRAGQGEYRRPLPVGYVYEDDESARVVMDPDEEVRRAVSLVFERFRRGGTLQDVVHHFVAHGLRFPTRLAGK